MAIDYIVNFDCRAKQELQSEGIIHLVKARTRAEALYNRFLEQGMSRTEAMNAQFGVQTQVANGESKLEMVSVASLFKQAELLDDHREACINCLASLSGAFGCYGAINYPITEAAESWLAKMAAKAISAGMPNSILIRFILDQDVKGEHFGGMRGLKEFTYLESEHPYEIEVEHDEGLPLLIDTNQILDMFFAVGEMQDVHQQFLLFFSGGLSIQDHLPDTDKIGVEYQVGVMQGEPEPRYWVYRMPDTLSDDRSIRQIKAYLRAIFAAQCTAATVSVDF